MPVTPLSVVDHAVLFALLFRSHKVDQEDAMQNQHVNLSEWESEGNRHAYELDRLSQFQTVGEVYGLSLGFEQTAKETERDSTIK